MKSPNLIRVWDLLTRIFHWLLVAGFFVAYFTEDELLQFTHGQATWSLV